MIEYWWVCALFIHLQQNIEKTLARPNCILSFVQAAKGNFLSELYHKSTKPQRQAEAAEQLAAGIKIVI